MSIPSELSDFTSKVVEVLFWDKRPLLRRWTPFTHSALGSTSHLRGENGGSSFHLTDAKRTSEMGIKFYSRPFAKF